MSMLLDTTTTRVGRGATMPNSINGNLSRDERGCAQRLLQVLEDLQVQRRNMTISQAVSFLQVALNEGTSVQELSKTAGVAQSVMSRHLLDLGPHTRSKEPGAGLVQHRMSATNMRTHEVLLTPKGVTLLRKIARILCGVGAAR